MQVYKDAYFSQLLSFHSKMTATIGILAIVGLICGAANALPPKQIVGGSEAAAGEFPYQVSLRYWNRHICGGAIVSKRHIITAAHCVSKLNQQLLSIGTGSIAFNGGENHEIKKIVRHELYDENTVGSPYDIAVITLKKDIKFDKNQDKVGLPSEETPGGVNAMSTGWGYPSRMTKTPPSTLMKIQLTTLSNKDCQMYFGRSSDITTNQLCTFNGRGRGTCQGDSGGPLVADGRLIGVVSWGIPCAIGRPDVFTRVSQLRDWIDQAMKA